MSQNTTIFPLNSDASLGLQFDIDDKGLVNIQLHTSMDTENVNFLRQSVEENLTFSLKGEQFNLADLKGENTLTPDMLQDGIQISLGEELFGSVRAQNIDSSEVSLQVDAQRHLTAFETRKLSSGTVEKGQYPFPDRAIDYSPQTDLHTHLAGNLSGEDLISVALDKGETFHYPLSLLEDVGVNIEPYAAQAKNGNIPLNIVSEADRHILSEAMSIPIDRQETFNGMEEIYRLRGPIAKDTELFAPILRKIAEDYQDKGVSYAELSHSAIITDPELLKIVHENLPSIQADTGVEMRFLAAMWRHSDLEWNADEVDRIKSISQSPYVVGADFMGHETNPTRDIVPHISRLAEWSIENDPDFTIRVHAGENPLFAAENVDQWSHNNVKEALQAVVDARESIAEKRGVSVDEVPMPRMRIGHGLYGVDDETISLFKQTGAIVEFNMSSNLALNNIDDIREIPIQKYSDAGIPVVLGMDGAGIYRTTPADEALLSRNAGMNEDGVKQLELTENSHIERAQQRFSLKQAQFEKIMQASGLSVDNIAAWQKVFETTYDTPDGRPSMTPQVAENMANKRDAEIEGVRKAIATTGAITEPDKIQEGLAGRTPIMLTSASKSSWSKISPEQQKEIQIAMDVLVHELDPQKAYLVTGGTDFGGERELHRSVAARNANLPEEQRISLVGTFTTEAQVEDIKPGIITHGTIMEMAGGRPAARWFDLPDTSLNMLEQNNGIMLAAGGGPVVRDMIQRAHNMGLEMILMDGPEGASTEKSAQLAGRGYDVEGAEGIIARLHQTQPNLFPADFDVSKLEDYKSEAIARGAGANIHISANEVEKLFDTNAGNVLPSPEGYRLLVQIPEVSSLENSVSPAADKNGNPIGITDIKDGKVIFRNPKDSVDNQYSWQGLDVDGSGVLILPAENEAMAKEMSKKLEPWLDKVREAQSGNKEFLIEDVDGLLKASYEAYSSLGQTPDIYNSNVTTMQEKMQRSGGLVQNDSMLGLYNKKSSPLDFIVLHAQPNETIAVSSTGKYIEGSEQYGKELVVLIREGDEIRKMDPEYAEKHYLNADGSPLRVVELPTYNARSLNEMNAADINTMRRASDQINVAEKDMSYITQKEALQFAQQNPELLTEAQTAGKRLYIGINISDLEAGQEFSYLNPKDAPKALVAEDGTARITVLAGDNADLISRGLEKLGVPFDQLPKGEYDNTVTFTAKGLTQDRASSLISDMNYTSQTVTNAAAGQPSHVIQASLTDSQASEVLDWWKDQGKTADDYRALVERIGEVQVRDGASIGDVYDDKTINLDQREVRHVDGNSVDEARGFARDGNYVRQAQSVRILRGEDFILEGSGSREAQNVNGQGILVFELDKDGQVTEVRSSAADHVVVNGNFLDAGGKALISTDSVAGFEISSEGKLGLASLAATHADTGRSQKHNASTIDAPSKAATLSGGASGVGLGLYGLVSRTGQVSADIEAGGLQASASLMGTSADVADIALGFAGIADDAGRGMAGASRLAGKVAIPLAVASAAGEAVAGLAEGDYERATKAGVGLGGALAGGQLGAGACAVAGPWAAAGCGIVGGLAGGFLGEEAVAAVFDLSSYREGVMKQRWEEGGFAAVDQVIEQTPVGEDASRAISSYKLREVAEAKTDLYVLLDSAPDSPSREYEENVTAASARLLQAAVAFVDPIITDNHADIVVSETTKRVMDANEMTALISGKTEEQVYAEATSITSRMDSYQNKITSPPSQEDLISEAASAARVSGVVVGEEDALPKGSAELTAFEQVKSGVAIREA